MWKSYDETDRNFYFKHSCITTVLASCILNKLVFESGPWAGSEYHSRSFKRSDSSLLSGPGVFAAPQVVFPSDFSHIATRMSGCMWKRLFQTEWWAVFFFFLSFLSLKTHGYFPKRRLRTCCKNTLALVYEVLRREFVTMASQRSSCSCSTEDNFWLRSSASPGPPAPLPCDYWSPP